MSAGFREVLLLLPAVGACAILCFGPLERFRSWVWVWDPMRTGCPGRSSCDGGEEVLSSNSECSYGRVSISRQAFPQISRLYGGNVCWNTDAAPCPLRAAMEWCRPAVCVLLLPLCPHNASQQRFWWRPAKVRSLLPCVLVCAFMAISTQTSSDSWLGLVS